MNEVAIARAIEALAIQDVYLHALRLEPAHGFEPRAHARGSVNFAWGARKSDVIEAVNDANGELAARFWRVYFETKCRILKIVAEDLKEGAQPNDEDVLCVIEARFIADYLMTSNVGEEALQEFASKNVSYHVWPYWRELLHDMAGRMRLSTITLPFHRVALSPPTK